MVYHLMLSGKHSLFEVLEAGYDCWNFLQFPDLKIKSKEEKKVIITT
jgi:hypothetical protein